MPATARPLYVPPPAKAPRSRRFRLRRVALALGFAGAATALFADRIGDQSAFAAIIEHKPLWAASVRAPDPGVALSPHVAAGPLTAAVGERVATASGEKQDSRLPAGDSAPAALASADDATPTRIGDVPPRRGSGDGTVETTRQTARAERPSTLSAYAPTHVSIETPFELLLGEDGADERPHGVSGGGRDHWWSDRPLPEEVTSKKSLRCLAEAIYFEARSESEYGQRAVAQVVLNRVKNPAYPDDVCAVVYQNRSWKNRCQFTFACDGTKDAVTNLEAWAIARRIAREYASGLMWLDEIGAATHYHARHVTPSWASLMRKAREIGHHIFYITEGGGWT